jgi:hypothetical protein
MHYILKWNQGQNWFAAGALALDSGIQSTKTIHYNIMETPRVWTTDLDNADLAVNFFVIVSQWVVALSR